MSNQNLGSVGEHEAASWKRYFLARKLELAVLPENLQRSHKSVPQDKEPTVDICHPNPHPLYHLPTPSTSTVLNLQEPEAARCAQGRSKRASRETGMKLTMRSFVQQACGLHKSNLE